MKRCPPMLIALCLPMLACADETPPEDRVASLVDQQVAELDEQNLVFCDCWENSGYDSRSDCNEDAQVFGPSQVRCMKEAFAQDAETAVDFLECVVPLEREYTNCVDQRLECFDGNSVEPCYDDFSVGYDNCIGLPDAISRDLDSCFE